MPPTPALINGTLSTLSTSSRCVRHAPLFRPVVFILQESAPVLISVPPVILDVWSLLFSSSERFMRIIFPTSLYTGDNLCLYTGKSVLLDIKSSDPSFFKYPNSQMCYSFFLWRKTFQSPVVIWFPPYISHMLFALMPKGFFSPKSKSFY